MRRLFSCPQTQKLIWFFHTAPSRKKFEEELSFQATAPPLTKYIANKYTWSESMVNKINWSAHGQALRKNKSRRSHLVKFIHDILPTTSLQNKYDGGNRTCPLCNDPLEDKDHILRCRHSTRETWRQNFLNCLSAYCSETQTCPQVSRLLNEVFHHWFNGEESPKIELTQYTSEVHIILRQQSQIGWRHLFQGRFANAWSEVQRKYHERVFPHQQYAPEKWQVGLIRKIWDQWYVLWSLRNQDLHGHDTRSRQKAETLETRRQLQRIYSQRQMMEPQVQDLLLASPESHEQYPLNATKNWLLMHTTTFSESVKRVKTMALHGVRSIRYYFTPTSVPVTAT